ncbi:MAG: FAD binding domain-containing protein [Myxococcales bacterium]|jgi:CO/xanthine dehydrogenase FAD-binding subunit|nr:FAD binding domain-containing protein [Myxococcales bacterium]
MIRAYHQPQRLDDALALLQQGGQAIAGATGLYSNRKKLDAELVDITGIGLSTIDVTVDAIRLGATVSLSQLIGAQLPGSEGAFLAHVARHITAAPMRNAITLGGNIAHPVFWADMPVAFLALDAELEIGHAGAAPKKIALGEAIKGQVPWSNGGLITHISVPLKKGQALGYERLSRTKNDYAYATAAAAMTLESGKAKDVRVVFGAIQPRAFRATDIEAVLEGKALTPELIAEAVDKAAAHLPIAPNFRASVDYRRQVACTLARRAIAQAFASAGQE